MKKMPCLFRREFHGRNDFTLTSDVSPGCEWVLAGEGVATIKWDGTACMFRDGKLYKRYDAKRGKTPPTGAIPCDPEPDGTTGHWPHWVLVGDEPDSKWHREALAGQGVMPDGTYELCGPHFNGNPQGYVADVFVPHAATSVNVPERTLDGLRRYLEAHQIEGLVFHHPDGRMVKIRRDDYGLGWGAKKARDAA